MELEISRITCYPKFTSKIRTNTFVSQRLHSCCRTLRKVCRLLFRVCPLNFFRIIISEQFLEESQKTVKQSFIGGYAGGKKYTTQGILFKFAVDVRAGDRWLYGGQEKDDGKAMRAAKHELKVRLVFMFNRCGNLELFYYLLLNTSPSFRNPFLMRLGSFELLSCTDWWLTFSVDGNHYVPRLYPLRTIHGRNCFFRRSYWH